MREAIGGTWLFNIVIFFVVLFTGYLCLSINHTKAFNVKDDVVKIIERHGGFEDLSNVSSNNDKAILTDIAESLQELGYRSTSSCPNADGGSVWFGFDREGKKANGNNAAFCIRKIDAYKGNPDLASPAYYQVIVFYQLDLPVFNSLFHFTIKGDTKLLYN